jgi:hypothetical protein
MAERDGLRIMHSFRLKSPQDFLGLLILLLGLAWLPLIFLNFDMHHDGLIVVSVENLKLALFNHGAWPFNQYGSTWIFPYVIVASIVPSSYLLLGIRLLTVVYYLVSARCIFLTSKALGGNTSGKIAVLLFFILQPWLGGWNSSFLPWPSSFSIMLHSILSLLVVRQLQENESCSRKSKFRMAFVGSLVFLAAGSRLQVGLILFAVVLLILLIKKIHLVTFYILGGLILSILWFLFLSYKGWLRDSLTDSILLAGQFISGEPIYYPNPYLSVLAGVALSAFVFLVQRYSKKNKKSFVITLTILVLILFSILIFRLYRLQSNSFNLYNFITITQRKTMAAVFFSTVIIGIFSLLAGLRSQNIHQVAKVFTRTDVRACFVLGLATGTQVWPFFDQMHIWWSFSPLCIITSLIIEALVRKNGTYTLQRISVVLLTFGMTILAIPFSQQFMIERLEVKSFGLSQIYLGREYEVNNQKLRNFLRAQMPLGSSVLNLCPNADPFLPFGDFLQETRFPVYWSSFSNVSNVENTFLRSHPDFIVRCETYYYTGSALENYRTKQFRIIEKVMGKEKFFASLEIGSSRWEIYRVKNSD